MVPNAAAALPPGKAHIDVTAHVRTPKNAILFNKHITFRSIGDAIIDCKTMLNDTQLCHVVYRFPLGNIIAIGTRRSTVYYRLAVVGGTGIYDNIGGEVQVITLDLSPHVIQLHFTIYAF